jgi:hypothetical protein
MEIFQDQLCFKLEIFQDHPAFIAEIFQDHPAFIVEIFQDHPARPWPGPGPVLATAWRSERTLTNCAPASNSSTVLKLSK